MLSVVYWPEVRGETWISVRIEKENEVMGNKAPPYKAETEQLD